MLVDCPKALPPEFDLLAEPATAPAEELERLFDSDFDFDSAFPPLAVTLSSLLVVLQECPAQTAPFPALAGDTIVKPIVRASNTADINFVICNYLIFTWKGIPEMLLTPLVE